MKEYESVFMKYMSPNDKVLEAGSGVGQVVLASRARGFDCYGPFYRFIEDKRFLRSLVDKILNLILPKFDFVHMIMVIATKRIS